MCSITRIKAFLKNAFFSPKLRLFQLENFEKVGESYLKNAFLLTGNFNKVFFGEGGGHGKNAGGTRPSCFSYD